MDEPAPLCGNISYFRHARNMSLKSNYRIKVGAVLVIGKSIVKGCNLIKSHPTYANPNKHTKVSIHAEISCLLKSKEFNKVGSKIFVYRETKDGPAMARPCSKCMKELKSAGIKKIYFSISDYPYYESEIIN